MSHNVFVPDPITLAWLTAVLRASGFLPHGEVSAVASEPSGAFNSRTSRLHLRYSPNVPADLASDLILKQNIAEDWGREAGAEEVKFYRLCAALKPAPPAVVPCYAADYDPASGDSYLLLQDLSETHVAPVTRDQQVSIVQAVPRDMYIDLTITALARHHAYWWSHPLLETATFEIGYWSRNQDRFVQYMQRRGKAWAHLIEQEASWFPAHVRELYTWVFDRLRQHWDRYLEPRFRDNANLTLIHGDAYFANFLCPRNPGQHATYLLDWQSPTVDIGGYDLANLCATFWTSAQRHEQQRETRILQRYHSTLQEHGVSAYSWADLTRDYRSGLIYWLLMPLQDRIDGASKDYWWPKMQCLVAAFEEWGCAELLQ